MDTTEHTAIPYEQYKAEAARLRREAMAAMWGQLGRRWRRPARQERPTGYGVGSGLATGQ
jgi:hypothetical protein